MSKGEEQMSLAQAGVTLGTRRSWLTGHDITTETDASPRPDLTEGEQRAGPSRPSAYFCSGDQRGPRTSTPTIGRLTPTLRRPCLQALLTSVPRRVGAMIGRPSRFQRVGASKHQPSFHQFGARMPQKRQIGSLADAGGLVADALHKRPATRPAARLEAIDPSEVLGRQICGLFSWSSSVDK